MIVCAFPHKFYAISLVEEIKKLTSTREAHFEMDVLSFMESLGHVLLGLRGRSPTYVIDVGSYITMGCEIWGHLHRQVYMALLC